MNKNIEEKAFFSNGIVYLKFFNKQQFESLGNVKVSSVHCFPIKDNEVLFTINPRGKDIIGGHVEKDETVEEALIREAMEEACIIPTKYEIIGAIEVNNRDNPQALEKGYPIKGYQLFYKITEFTTKEFKQTHECNGREYIDINEISQQHHNWLNVHDKLLKELNINEIQETKRLKI